MIGIQCEDSNALCESERILLAALKPVVIVLSVSYFKSGSATALQLKKLQDLFSLQQDPSCNKIQQHFFNWVSTFLYFTFSPSPVFYRALHFSPFSSFLSISSHVFVDFHCSFLITQIKSHCSPNNLTVSRCTVLILSCSSLTV